MAPPDVPGTPLGDAASQRTQLPGGPRRASWRGHWFGPRREHGRGFVVRLFVTAVALAVAATGGVIALSGPATALAPVEGPAGDAFYQPPSTLPAGNPGDVIRYRKLADAGNANVYLVMYLSRNTHSQPIAVTGTIFVPKNRNPATVPVVGFASGTAGIGDTCAPSKNLLYSQVQFGNAIDRGWAVAVTDYEGLGTPGDHTYVVGRAEGHAVLDAVRAAQRLPQTGLSATAKVGLLGYSQGGGAAAWAGELARTYAPELNLVGVSAGGVPADLLAVSRQLDGGLGFGVLAMAALGLDAAYPELNLEGYLNQAGREAFARQSQACVADGLFGLAFRRISDFTTSNPLASPAWQARLAEQKLGANPPRVPILLYHAWPIDELVERGQAEALRRTYCAAGANVTWKDFLGEHATTLFVAQTDGLNFLSARFAGTPVRGNC